MIIGNLKDSADYECIHPLFKKAFDYLKSLDPDKAELGKVDLQGTDLYLVVSDSRLKTEQEAKLEVHDRYIDIQLPLSKAEKMGWSPRCVLKDISKDFDENKDIGFYEDKPSFIFSLAPGNFAIFFPEDGHAPCIGEGSIRKVVVKVKQKIYQPQV